MTDDAKKTWLSHMAAMGRDVLTMAAVISLVSGIAAVATRTYWQPFADLPVIVAAIQKEIAETQATLQGTIRPQLIDFQGNGQIVGTTEIEAGGLVEVFYSLRRNASCDTDVRPYFFDIERGLTVAGQTIPAVRAPVTSDFIPFRLSIRLPDQITPGTYVYYPEIIPKNCGVYGPLRAPPTSQFVVR